MDLGDAAADRLGDAGPVSDTDPAADPAADRAAGQAQRRAVEAKLAARYGTAARSRWPRFAVAALVLAYLGVAAWAALALSQRSVEGNVLTWQARERQVDVELEVRGSAPGGVDCVVKASDANSVDVGYSTVRLPQPPGTYSVSIPTVVRAGSVSVLGCAPAGEELRVPPPDFPPGVAIP